MSAKHAVLGLVIERPGYGYDLARRLGERFGSSRFAPTGVYSALDQLSAEGLVRAAGSPAGVASERGAPRTIYEATAEGHERFDRWMLSGCSPANVRDELNMRLALSRQRDLPALIELAHCQERQCLARLESLRRGSPSAAVTPTDAGGPAVERGQSPALGPAAAGQRGALAWRQIAGLLVRDAEARQLQARIEWLQRARAIMTRLVRSPQSQQSPVEYDEDVAARAAHALERAAGTDGSHAGAGGRHAAMGARVA